MVAAALLAFALSDRRLRDLELQLRHHLTFPLYVFGVALRGIPVQVNVLATILFLVTSIAIALVLWQQRRAEKLAAVQPEPEPA